jgi:hypothetical protein
MNKKKYYKVNKKESDNININFLLESKKKCLQLKKSKSIEIY